MKTTIARATAALMAKAGAVLAGAHNNASENDNRSEKTGAALSKVPAGLAKEGSPGLVPAITKGGNGNKGDE